ncbi:MAG: hypothetical protein J5611_00305, partial [Alphaproteobacteria bacterium]|nr:hypothetical protein [Alphaproteobacteria bacterium]
MGTEESKFLPDSVSGALRGFLVKLLGGALFCLVAWAILALFFHNPYLNGVAASSNFGDQSVMGNFVGWLRYMIGYVP